MWIIAAMAAGLALGAAVPSLQVVLDVVKIGQGRCRSRSACC
jgi:hypothetical protein